MRAVRCAVDDWRLGNGVGSQRDGRDQISALLWDHNEAVQAKVAKLAGACLYIVRLWLQQHLSVLCFEAYKRLCTEPDINPRPAGACHRGRIV